MIDKEILKKIRRIQISTSRKVTDVFAGQYKSMFKGIGMEFDEVREYMPGDEIRSIDWNVTARTGHPFIKKFVEERELTIMLLLDISKSSLFGTRNNLKRSVAAEVCSAIAFSAIKNNDKVGMMTFSDKVEKYIPPRKGSKHVLRVIREALYSSQSGDGTDMNVVLEALSKISTRKTITFIISDFFTENFKKNISIANKKHDIIAITIMDPAEKDLPNIGILKVHDAETGEEKDIDTSDKRTMEEYRKNSFKRIKEREDLLRSVNVDRIDISTDKSYVDPLVKFFKMREKRLSRR